MSKGTVNKVIILGRLGQDPEGRATQSGTPVATLNVATNHGVKDSQNNWSDATEWHRCVVFGKSAENAMQYLSKGSSVYLEGRLQTRKWQDQATGQDRYTTEIVCNEMQFVGGNPNAQAQAQPQQAGAQADPWATPSPHVQPQPQQAAPQQLTPQQQQQQWQEWQQQQQMKAQQQGQ